MKKEIVFLVFVLVISSVSAQLAGSPWPMYHGKATHGGQSSIDTSHVNGYLKWTFQAGGAIETSPVIGEDGTIYFGAHDNKFYAVNPDGTLKWSFYVGKPKYDDIFDVYKGILSTAAVAKDGTIYFSSLSDWFFALNPDGTEKWRYEVPITSDSWTSPIIGDDGTVYTGAARRKLEGSQEQEHYPQPIGGIYAFNPDGTLKWHFASDSDMAGSIAIKDGVLYAFLGENVDQKTLKEYVKDGSQTWLGFIKAIDANGKEKWKYPIVFTESSPTIADDGSIYVGAGHASRGFLALNPDGSKKWFFKTTNDISLIPAIANDGTIYVGEWDGVFYAFNPDGSIKWTFPTPKGHESLISSPAIGAEGTIYFGAKDGLHALNPDGTEKWHYQRDIGSIVSSPAIGPGGTIYVGSWNHKLYAFGSGEIIGDISESSAPYEGSGDAPTCPDGIWDEREQADPKLCPPDNPNLDEEEKAAPESYEKREFEGPYEERQILYEEPRRKRGFFSRILDWIKTLFGGKPPYGHNPEEFPKRDIDDVCLTPEEYELGEPILSIPFNVDDYYPKSWGIVPFCADPWDSGNMHNAIDFELNSGAKVYAAADGAVLSKSFSDIEGAGEIMLVQGDGFFLDYSGLKDIRLEVGDSMKKRDYIADVYETPYGEYHVHLGINIGGKDECPIKYMDQEFKDALKQMFAQAHYLRQDEEPCVCNCEYIISNN